MGNNYRNSNSKTSKLIDKLSMVQMVLMSMSWITTYYYATSKSY